MTTIIRRTRRRHPAPGLITIAVVVLALVLVVWLVMAIWAKGGPQPVHEIVIALPAPQVAPSARRHA